MDKPSERKADSKKRDGSDVDIGVWDYKAGGKCETLDGLWHKPTTITGGSADQRVRDNNYCKEAHAKNARDTSKDSLKGLFDAIVNDTGGPPFDNISKPKRVF